MCAAVLSTNSPSITPTQTSSAYKKVILQYYQDVDACRFSDVLNGFSPNAVYERQNWLASGWMKMTGLSELTTFFHQKRKLRGEHIIQHVTEQASQLPKQLQLLVGSRPFVFTTGLFKGTIEDQPVSLAFKDLWVFEPKQVPHNLKVFFRKSWISPTSFWRKENHHA